MGNKTSYTTGLSSGPEFWPEFAPSYLDYHGPLILGELIKHCTCSNKSLKLSTDLSRRRGAIVVGQVCNIDAHRPQFLHLIGRLTHSHHISNLVLLQFLHIKISYSYAVTKNWMRHLSILFYPYKTVNFNKCKCLPHNIK